MIQLAIRVTWHVILNNSTSTRPSKRGGKLFPSLSSLYVDLQDNDRYKCFLQFPCSFAPDDGFDFQVSGCGGSVDEARNVACLQAFAYLFKQRPEWVIFRSNHWNMSDVQFCEGLLIFFSAEQVRIQPASGGRKSRYEPLPQTLSGPGDALICQILKDCLDRVGKPCDPSGLRSHEWKLLERFVELESFVQS